MKTLRSPIRRHPRVLAAAAPTDRLHAARPALAAVALALAALAAPALASDAYTSAFYRWENMGAQDEGAKPLSSVTGATTQVFTQGLPPGVDRFERSFSAMATGQAGAFSVDASARIELVARHVGTLGSFHTLSGGYGFATAEATTYGLWRVEGPYADGTPVDVPVTGLFGGSAFSTSPPAVEGGSVIYASNASGRIDVGGLVVWGNARSDDPDFGDTVYVRTVIGADLPFAISASAFGVAMTATSAARSFHREQAEASGTMAIRFGTPLQVGREWRWVNPVSGDFDDAERWRDVANPTVSGTPSFYDSVRFDVAAAYVVRFDDLVQHRDATVWGGDVGLALDGEQYVVDRLVVRPFTDTRATLRVLGQEAAPGELPALRPDGRLTARDATVEGGGVLRHAGWLHVGDLPIADPGAGGYADEVDVQVMERLRIRFGGQVIGNAWDYGVAVNGFGNTGRLEIERGGSLLQAYQMEVGGSQGGRATVRWGGAIEVATTLSIGAPFGRPAELRVLGWDMDADDNPIPSELRAPTVIVGEARGSGSGPNDPRGGMLAITDGARLLAEEIILGPRAGADGLLVVQRGATVDGLFTQGGVTALVVGQGGFGEVIVSDGAQVAAATTIGSALATPDGVQRGGGRVTLLGGGSHLPAAQNTRLDSPLLVVGAAGTGELVASQGAQIHTSRVEVGAAATGFGSLSLQGAGTRLTLTPFGSSDPGAAPVFAVGPEGSGRLEVLDGAEVIVAPGAGGLVEVGSGLVEIRRGARIVSAGANVGPNGTVIGDAGSWQVDPEHTFVLGGRLEIGASPGWFTIDGNFEQIATGVLQIEFAGTAPDLFDRLIVTGAATLAGRLELSFIDGFAPAQGDSFEFLAVGEALAGGFDEVVVLNLASGFEFELDAGGGAFRMVALNDGIYQPIPEPGTWALMLLGSAGLLAWRRRARPVG